MYLGILDSVLHWAQYEAHKAAISTSKETFSYADLRDSAAGIASQLSDTNVGERIAVLSRKPFTIVSSLLASEWLGLVVAVLNPDLRPQILAQNITDCQPSTLIIDDTAPIESTSGIRCIQFDSKLRTAYPERRPAGADTEILKLPWGILFSSGSTGAPKAILHNYYSISTELLCWILELPLHRNDKFFVGRPVYYTGGLVLTLATLLVGASVAAEALTDPSSVAEMLRIMEETAAGNTFSWAFLSPRVAVMLAASGHIPSRTAFEKILLMGAAVSHDQKISISETFKAYVVESWGNSEGLGTISFPEDWKAHPGTVGRPFVSEKIIVVSEHNHALPPNTIGRVAGVDESYFSEYLGRPDATAAAKIENIVVSDDLGYLDEDGYLYLKGRRQQSFVVDNVTRFSIDIEGEITRLPGVSECVVLPLMQDPSHSHVGVVLKVVVITGPDSQWGSMELKIMDVVRAASGLDPSSIEISRLLTMPLTPSGKVDLTQL